jgi:hypothetical protein
MVARMNHVSPVASSIPIGPPCRSRAVTKVGWMRSIRCVRPTGPPFRSAASRSLPAACAIADITVPAAPAGEMVGDRMMAVPFLRRGVGPRGAQRVPVRKPGARSAHGRRRAMADTPRLSDDVTLILCKTCFAASDRSVPDRPINVLGMFARLRNLDARMAEGSGKP